MKQGEIWTIQDTGYASKPRPVLIIQKEVSKYDSVILCLLTSFDSTDLENRVEIEPTSKNGLNCTSFVMTDKILTVNKNVIGKRVGKLEANKVNEVLSKIAQFLGIS